MSGRPALPSIWCAGEVRRRRAGRRSCATTHMGSRRWPATNPVAWRHSAPDDGMDRQPTDGGLWVGATPSLSDPRSGCCYGDIFVRRVRSLGIRDHPTAARSPWQSEYAERLIGSIRRECLYHIVVMGEQHLRHILMCYMEYYNTVRTHLSLGKDAPVRRLIQRTGRIQGSPVLGGLHHQYVRI